MRRLLMEDHSTLMDDVMVLYKPLTARLGKGGRSRQRSSGSLSSSIGCGDSTRAPVRLCLRDDANIAGQDR